MSIHPNKLAVLAVAIGLAAACTNAIDSSDPVTLGKTDAQKALPWSSNDDPRIFSNDLIYKLADLPREGETERPPWAASYWPNYMDSINYKWDGADSQAPSTKYGQAFGETGIEDAVSNMRGIDSQDHRTACTETSECDDDLGEQCAKREGQDNGFCVPTWFGICHAWAPAALLVPEPIHPVTHNGVEFKVNDIKALVTLAHDRVVNRFASGRCNAQDSADKIEYDELGRPLEGDCIDTNPATFHILLANYLGLQSTGFVYDRTYDAEVWNQPIRSFNVTSLEEVSALDANRLVGVTSTGGTNVEHADQHVDRSAWQHFDPVAISARSPVTVRMSGTGDADLYVRFGEQATAEAYDCRPYDNGSDETCEVTAPEGATEVFVSVNGYQDSDFTVNITAGGEMPTKYQFNDRAVKFYEVALTVKFISESDATTDGNLEHDIERYTHTDRYDYILEEDAQGRLIGGEWLGASKRAHPDFLWLPVRHGSSSVASGKIKYAEVMDLLNKSIADPEGGEGEGEGETVTVNEAGHVDQGAMVQFGPYSVGAGQELVAHLTGSGDADLYVRKNAAPSVAAYDCRPYKNGSTEDCTAAGAGQIFVAVYGYSASDFELNITYTGPGGGEGEGEGEGEDPVTTHLNETGSVDQGQMNYYVLEVTAGQSVVVRTQAESDIDVYVREGARPSTSNYAANGYTSSGNETVSFTATQTGALHIGVHGYQAGSYTVTTADQ